MAADRSFLGIGWDFPPTFDRSAGGVRMISDEPDIGSSLEILLSTDVGERVMQPRYGCDMHRLLFEPLDTTLRAYMKDLIWTAILYFEPRIILDDVILEARAARRAGRDRDPLHDRRHEHAQQLRVSLLHRGGQAGRPMSTECFFRNPLRRDGTSQRQRAPKALDPAYARIDERTLGDLVRYAGEYAELLRYYTASNSPGGDWVDFVETDVTAMVALIGGVDRKASREGFQQRVESVKKAPAVAVLGAYAELFDPILTIARAIDRWHGGLAQDLDVWRELDRLIRASLNDALREALVMSLRVNELDPSIGAIGPEVSTLSGAWEMSSVEPDRRLFKGGSPVNGDDREDALRRIGGVFDRFHETQVVLQTKAESFLLQTLEDYPRHAPHMALFLASLRLYSHAQDHLNSLGGKHLDFYYERVLRLHRKPANPDDAHVVFELAKNAEPHLLKTGTGLNGGKDDSGVLRMYEIVDEIVVNRAVIDKDHGLKTVFVETVQPDPNDESTREVVNLFAAPDADSADGLGADLEDEDGKWATFGSGSLPFAELGFAIASPMFVLSEGTRTITVGFHLSSSSPVNAHVAAELTRNVRIWMTGDGDWLEIPVADVEVMLHAPGVVDGSFAFHIIVRADQGAIVGYDAKLHGGRFDTTHPIIKFMLDADGLAWNEYAVTSQGPGLDADFPEAAPVGTADIGIVDYSDDVLGYNKPAVVRYEGHLYQAQTDIVDRGVKPDSDANKWKELTHSHPYKYFQQMDVVDIDVTLNIDGVRSLVLENDVWRLDPAKPFLPFGPVPKVGSSFYIGSAEVFGKPLTDITLGIEWADLPQVSFAAYYNSYQDPPLAVDAAVSVRVAPVAPAAPVVPVAPDVLVTPVTPVTPDIPAGPIKRVDSNSDFKAVTSLLVRGTWRDLPSPGTARELFATKAGGAPDPVRTIDMPVSPGLVTTTLAPFARFGALLRRGFVRLKLGEQDFLHRAYPRYLAAAAADGGDNMPNQPYTPLIASLTVDYEAQHSFGYPNLSKNDFQDRVDKLFQIGPFGYREIFPIADDASAATVPIDRSLVPRFEVTVANDTGDEETKTAEGTLFIGIAKLEPVQNLSVLFRVAEGSEDPDGTAQAVLWSYLSNDTWVDFKSSEILSDGTNGLLGSGIITFVMPKEMTVSEALLPGKLHWIKASVHKQTDSVPKLIAVHSQAAVARFHDKRNDPSHLSTALPAGTIGKLMRRDSAIKSVTQPYASFGGRLPETDAAFRVRVSERLRHKWRAVSIYDYERLVLEQFPEVYKVKCLNHASVDREYVPGEVKIIVVPSLRNQNAVDPLRPRLSRNKLVLIKEFLDEISSDFVTIHVSSPSYERVRADFQVRFHRGRDQGLYTTQLQKDLVRFLSPWLYDDAAELKLGGRVHRSSILNFVDELEYVDFVTDFKLDQLFDVDRNKEPLTNIEEAEATTSSAALVSAIDHKIGYAIHAWGRCLTP